MDFNRAPGRGGAPFTRADSDDIIQFERRRPLGHVELHGVVTDVARDERHYAGGYKFLRSLLYGEPYQLRKAGRNDYGATASYTTIRLEPLEQTGQAREILCFGELDSRVACGDEVIIHARSVRGRYHFRRGENLTLGGRIRGDLFTVNPGVFLLPLALLGVLIIGCLPELKRLLSELAVSAITLGAIVFLLYITVFRDIANLFRRR